MATSLILSSSSSSSSSSSFLVYFLLLLSQFSFRLVASHTTVKFLPGFQGPLPFHLETGYVGVGETEEVQLFYHFIKSERNPKEDPLLFWLTGGPGCSSFSSLAFEIGPIYIKVEEYNGTLPTLVLNPNSWTKISSIIFLDLPANSGFSYTKPPTPIATQRSDSKQISHGIQFLRKWLVDHPEFLSNPLYVGGESYCGITVPTIALEILKGNEASIAPSINFEGYVLGNPWTNVTQTINSRVSYVHGMGLISDELYESLKSTCGGEYRNVDPSNKVCLGYIEAYNDCISGLNGGHILEPKCFSVSPKPRELLGSRRSLIQKPELLLPPESQLPTIGCRRSYGYLLSHYWSNNDTVREALGIRKGTIREWIRCVEHPYTSEILDVIPIHAILSTKGHRSLVYSGDHDPQVPFIGTQEWIRSLNYSIVDDWRPWLVEGQVAGYQRTYSNRMTFATVKGGGHTAPEYKPKECFAMFERWISKKPL